MQGFALTQEQVIELLSVYATAEQYLEAVAVTPGWYVIGGFPMPADADVQVDVIGAVSDAALALRVRLYDVTDGEVAAVSGSEATTSETTDTQFFSGVVTLQGGHLYQWQAEVTGGAGVNLFGVVRRATLRGT